VFSFGCAPKTALHGAFICVNLRRLRITSRLLRALKSTSFDVIFDAEVAMRTTLALDDNLLAEAQSLTGLQEKSALIREALIALIERESARRLARLGGSAPDLELAPRRRDSGR
jgi:Arc/MetJ family transcription regulator